MQYVICSRMKLKFHVSYRILSPLAYFLEKTHQIYSRHMLKSDPNEPTMPNTPTFHDLHNYRNIKHECFVRGVCPCKFRVGE